MRISERRSILFNVIESLRGLEGLPKTTPVFYVTTVTANARIKDILESVLPEEQIADHSETWSFLSHPELSQLSNCVYLLL